MFVNKSIINQFESIGTHNISGQRPEKSMYT